MQALKKFFLFVCFVLFTVLIFAQTTLQLPRNFLNAYEKNNTRSLNGEPGKNYWQNTADYTIDVHFNPETLMVSGSETIVYTNNSPDTLHNTWFKLYPNLYKKGNIRDMSIDQEDLTNGVKVTDVFVNDSAVNNKAMRINGTNMVLRNTTILPHSTDIFIYFK